MEYQMGGVCSMHREMRTAYKTLVGKPEGKRPCVSPRCRWESNFRMYLLEIVREGVDWIHLAQHREWWRVLWRR